MKKEDIIRIRMNRRAKMDPNFMDDKNIIKYLEPENYKIRIYGNNLGSSRDIILLWEALEKNYITILAYEKLIEIFGGNSEEEIRLVEINPYLNTRTFRGKNKDLFMQHFNTYPITDMYSPDDYPIITKINFNSPGWWEVLGKWNIFEQIRKYLKERHERKKDIEFEWDTEKQKSQAEIESMQLSNDLLKLEITQKMIMQLKSLGLTDVEIRHYIKKCYGNLYLLDPHIEQGRLVDIKIVDAYEDEI